MKSNDCGASRYQYEYRCCQVRGIGGCEAEFTGWTEVEKGKELTGLAQQSIHCEAGHALRGFVLEAKDPGKNSHLRKDEGFPDPEKICFSGS